MSKNVLQKHWNGSEWVEIHPVTKTTNVIDQNGQSVQNHIGDSTRHITAAERTAWNAKETTEGAQQKANAVQNNLNSHTNNTTVHITATERTNWNAKETTSGAQSKANAAENNAKNASLPRSGGTISGNLNITGTARVNGNDIWHAGNAPQTRLNNGVFEVNNGGWKPVGGVKSVQRGNVRVSIDTTNVTISSVNRAKSMSNLLTFASGEGSSTNYGLTLTSNTNLRINRWGSSAAEVYWEVIEYY